MRAAAVILLALAILSTLGFGVTAFHEPSRAKLRELRAGLFGQPVPAASVGTSGDAELAASIERMAAGIDAIVASGSIAAVQSGSGHVSVSGVSAASVSASGSVQALQDLPKRAEPEYPLSGILLARIMPEVFPKKIENRAIFDIYLFNEDALLGATYFDEKTKTKFYVFTEGYSVMLSNLKLVPQTYSVNETDTFFSSTFFLNSTNKKDSSVRFVVELEGKAVGIEASKSFYPKLKKMLLQN